jgi:hypothetical protein
VRSASHPIFAVDHVVDVSQVILYSLWPTDQRLQYGELGGLDRIASRASSLDGSTFEGSKI